MPSKARREEQDTRAGRFESELRTADFERLKTTDNRLKQKVFMCGTCRTTFEERSRVCPRCDTRTMGELRPIRESDVEAYRKKSIERIRNKYV